MNSRRAWIAAMCLGWSAVVASGGEELSRIWSDPDASVRQRAAAVNEAFTNGTPVMVVVAALGTNFSRCYSSGRVWMGPGPGPPNSSWLSYRFGEDSVSIYTTATIEEPPLSGKFTGAGYSIRFGRGRQAADAVSNSQDAVREPLPADALPETSETMSPRPQSEATADDGGP